MIFSIVLALIVLFGFVAFIGAPYVPTLRADAQRVLRLRSWSKREVVVDLGSGDGIILRLLAPKVKRAIGYELSPPLYFWSRWRSRNQKNITIYYKNFWTTPLPHDTNVVYTFLAERYMKKCYSLLLSHVEKTQTPLLFISYSFELPNIQPIAKDGPMFMYQITPLQT